MRAFAIAALGILTWGVSACRLFDEDGPNALMIAEISTALGVDDTLIVTRSIENRGRRTLYLDVSSSVPGYEAWNSANQPVCHLGFTTMELELLAVMPGTVATTERRIAVASLQNCQPGSYTVRVTAHLHSNAQASDEPAVLRSTVSTFVITAP